MKFLIILILFIKNFNAQDQDNEGVLCSARTCSDYISASPCPTLPDNCIIQNSTHSGLLLPYPDPCNCCKFCLVNLKEGDYCAVGEAGGLVPDSICGPGLSCSGGQCVKMTSLTDNVPVCSAAQAAYDRRRESDQLMGTMEERPDCDDDGFYAPYRCVRGQTCFCVDKTGNRIFGEIPFTSSAPLVLKCECPRKYYEVLKFFGGEPLHPDEHFRCTETGDYDTIQCIGNDCMCTDASDGAPTFPTKASVDINKISKQTLGDCFNDKIHETNKYYHSCAEEYLRVLNEVKAYKTDGFDEVFEVEYPNCDLDGNYAPVQKITEMQEDGTKIIYNYCANPDGTPITDYKTVDDAQTDDPMDCKCARSSLLMPTTALEKPECCLNGNFNRVQCRRGKCYCVDSDGFQNVDNASAPDKPYEVNIAEKTTLFCYNTAYNETCLGTS